MLTHGFFASFDGTFNPSSASGVGDLAAASKRTGNGDDFSTPYCCGDGLADVLSCHYGD